MIDSLIYADKTELVYLLKKLTLAYKNVYKNKSKKQEFLNKLHKIGMQLKTIPENKELIKKFLLLKEKIENLDE